MVQHNKNATGEADDCVLLSFVEKAILLTKNRLYKLWDQKNLIHI